MKYSDRKTSQCILPFNELFELNKRVNTEATAHLCSADVFKNQMFYKICVLENFTIFKGKHLYWSFQ